VLEPTPPGIASVAVAAGAHNVLHAVVTASLLDADSVTVRYGVAGATLDSVTPVAIAHDSQQLDVLGLLPRTAYRMQVVAYGHGLSAESDTVAFTTGDLPTTSRHIRPVALIRLPATWPSRRMPTASSSTIPAGWSGIERFPAA